MRFKKIPLDAITFINSEYTDSLCNSLHRIGLSFPIKVVKKENGYTCEDGNKRLSIIRDSKILLEKMQEGVYCIIMNDGSSRSNDCWRSKNTH